MPVALLSFRWIVPPLSCAAAALIAMPAAAQELPDLSGPPDAAPPLQDAAEDVSLLAHAAIAQTLDFTVEVLPPLRLPKAGSPELEHVDKGLVRPLVPITARPRDAAPPTMHFSLVTEPMRLATLEDGSAVHLHIDGLPGADAAPREEVAAVAPQAVDPSAFSMGARWGMDDHIDFPLIDAVAWHAQADLATGGAPDRGTTVIRRSLRLTAQWDRPEDFSIGLTQGVQVGGGTAFDHYATGVSASLFDTRVSPFSHWSGYVELTGEHLALNSLAQNLGATVNAGASWRASRSAELDVSVSRGLAPTAVLQSNVGLSMHF